MSSKKEKEVSCKEVSKMQAGKNLTSKKETEQCLFVNDSEI